MSLNYSRSKRHDNSILSLNPISIICQISRNTNILIWFGTGVCGEEKELDKAPQILTVGWRDWLRILNEFHTPVI